MKYLIYINNILERVTDDKLVAVLDFAGLISYERKNGELNSAELWQGNNLIIKWEKGE